MSMVIEESLGTAEGDASPTNVEGTVSPRMANFPSISFSLFSRFKIALFLASSSLAWNQSFL